MAVLWCWWCHQWDYCICTWLIRGIIWPLVLVLVPMPLVSPNQKSHVSQFGCLDLRSAKVLMTPLALCGTSAGTNVVSWSKSHVAPHFNHSDQRSAIVQEKMPWVSCNGDSKDIEWPKRKCCISIWLPCPKESDSTIDGAISITCADTGGSSIMWPKCHFSPNFDHLVWSNAMLSVMMPSASCDIDSNDVTWPKSHVAPQFNCLDLRSAVVSLMMPLV